MSDEGPLRRLGWLRVAAVCTAWCAATPSAAADDVVYFSTAKNPHARIRVSGTIVDYTGRQIVIEQADGRQVKRPGSQAVEIQTDWPPDMRTADELFARCQFAEAREKYAAAARVEKRGWVRRRIVAQVVICYREQNQFEKAGKLFLGLVREDPDTPYFDTIPLSWLPAEPSPALEQVSLEWLESRDAPLAVLLGASHLLTTSKRAAALARLEALAGEKDPRLARLARAQFWRGTLATARGGQVAAWIDSLEKFPSALRAGPYLVLGEAVARRGSPDQAALLLLHVPILYPDQGRLAAEALWDAGQMLEKAGQSKPALRIYQELAAGYPDSRPAGEARARLAELKAGESPPLSPPPAPSFAADTLEEEFLAGLRHRRLFEPAEAYCQQQLAAATVPDVRQAELTIELARCLTEHALQTPTAEREPLWEEARVVVDEFLRGQPRNPRRVLVEVQLGLMQLARGEQSRQEAELGAAADQCFTAARGELRAAIATFQSAAETIAELLRRANQGRRGDSETLTPDELAALQRNVNYQLARAYRNQGQSYPPASPDRTNSLRQAVDALRSIAAADSDDAVTWQARIDEIVCDRLLEDYRAASTRLAALEGRQPPARVALAARAERIRLALDRKRPQETQALLDAGRTLEGQTSPELDFAFLEAYVATWRSAAKRHLAEEAARAQTNATAMVQEIDSRYGPYWSRRAETLLAGSVTSLGGSQNLAVLVRAAESLYRAGRTDEALAAYDRATVQAIEAKNTGAAFDAGYTAASIEQQRRRFAAAAERFRRLSTRWPEHPKADGAHLLAIFNTAQAGKEDAAAADDEKYLALLGEHLELWPHSAGASQARIWLGRLREQQNAWSEAIDAYRGVAADRSQFIEALSGTARCYHRWLSELAEAGQSTDEKAAAAARYFEGQVTGSGSSLPEHWTQPQREAATFAAAFWLEYTDDRFARAEKILCGALADSAQAPAAWRTTAKGLLAFALAGQDRREEARRLLDDLAEGSPEELLQLIAGLGRMAGGASPAAQRELAELELRAGELLRRQRQSLNEPQRHEFDLSYARALVSSGRRDDAVAALRRLADESPRDGRLQEEYAQLLLDGSDKASLQAALEKWQDIAGKCRQGSDRWMRAVYGQALAQERLAHRDQAARLIKLAQGLHPDLGGAKMKARFLELLRRLDRIPMDDPGAD